MEEAWDAAASAAFRWMGGGGGAGGPRSWPSRCGGVFRAAAAEAAAEEERGLRVRETAAAGSRAAFAPDDLGPAEPDWYARLEMVLRTAQSRYSIHEHDGEEEGHLENGSHMTFCHSDKTAAGTNCCWHALRARAAGQRRASRAANAPRRWRRHAGAGVASRWCKVRYL